jgi:hypothetical protein
MHAANRALTGGQASTHDKDLASSVKLEFPNNFAFMSKRELRSAYESLLMEFTKLKGGPKTLNSVSDPIYNKEAITNIILENVELNRQLTGVLKENLALEKKLTSTIPDSSDSPHLKIA